MPDHAPRHARPRAAGRGAAGRAIFVDESGRRARWAHIGLRAIFALCIVGLGLVVVSLLGGVPLPGLTDPVQLPSGEAAHPRSVHPSPSGPYGIGSGVSTTAPGQALPGTSPEHTDHPGLSPSAAAAVSSSAARTTAVPTSPRRTTPPAANTSNPGSSHTPRGSGARHTPTPHNTKPRPGIGAQPTPTATP